MNELKNTAKLVKFVLERSEKARNSDNYLYFQICRLKLKNKGINIASISLQDGLLRRKEFDFPTFETVRRTRQKLQAENPELVASDKVQEIRADKEEIFRDYARS